MFFLHCVIQARAKREAEEKAILAEKRAWQLEGRREENLKSKESMRESEARKLEEDKKKSENLRAVIIVCHKQMRVLCVFAGCIWFLFTFSCSSCLFKAKAKRMAEEQAINREKRQWQIQGKMEANMVEEEKRKIGEAEAIELNRIKSEQLRTVLRVGK